MSKSNKSTKLTESHMNVGDLKKALLEVPDDALIFFGKCENILRKVEFIQELNPKSTGIKQLIIFT